MIEHGVFLFVLKNLCRRQFDLANREAMDESAEWRLKYDVEVERSTNCAKELNEVQIQLNSFVGISFCALELLGFFV